jgi:hypothetical protein
MQEVIIEIYKRNNSKSPELDGLSMELIKNVTPMITELFTYINNYSYQDGFEPNELE